MEHCRIHKFFSWYKYSKFEFRIWLKPASQLSATSTILSAHLQPPEKFPRSSGALRLWDPRVGSPVGLSPSRPRLTGVRASPAGDRNYLEGPRNLAAWWWAPPWRASPAPTLRKKCWSNAPRRMPTVPTEGYPMVTTNETGLEES